MILNPLPAPCPSYTTHRTDVDNFPAAWSRHRLVKMRQPHGNQVEIVEHAQDPAVLECDGLITATPNLHLQVKTADCLPILIYHPTPVIAAIHAGRKGTQKDIVHTALAMLQNQFNATNQLQIWFGPAICKNCYQIDQQTDLHYDLIAENTRQVRQFYTEADAQITVSEYCTAHHNDQFFSYRKEGKQVPMNYSGIVLD